MNQYIKSKLIVWFKEVGKEDVALVGGKGANLGEMIQAGFPVPNGFILTSAAYFHYLEYNRLQTRIHQALADMDRNQPDQLLAASSRIKKLIRSGEMPPDIAKLIFKYYEKLDGVFHHPLVAVRSSATAEDLPDASFAGQQETFLNIKGEAALIEAVKSSYASLFTPRAIFYREEKGYDHFKVGLATPIQKMVRSEVSGVMFTVDPVTGNKNVMVIESVWGLGEFIVLGKVTPDQYLVDKQSFRILTKNQQPQKIQLVLKEGKNATMAVPASKQSKLKLTDRQITEVARIGKKIQQHYFFPQDIEWAYEKNRFYLLQTRPITTLNNKPKIINNKYNQTSQLKLIAKGDGASPGLVTGYAVIIHSPKEIAKIKRGDILVTSMTSPDFVPAMKRAVGIVTDKGGLTSHAAIVSRELGVPCVVGTKNGTRQIKNHRVITLNGRTGEVFSGSIRHPKTDIAQLDAVQPEEPSIALTTATKVYVNLADPGTAATAASLPVDGVGLLRAEFIMAQLKVHPKKIIKERRQASYINDLAAAISTFCQAFYPRPVIYRTADFKTNEYANLTGGKEYEPSEANPMMGWRGVTRYLHDEPVFELELAAIKKVRIEQKLSNLYMMLPFVRTVNDLIAVKRLMAANRLIRQPNFRLYMMCEVPSNVILLEDFIKVGIDGVSIGSNDLTMLTLGADRDNENLSRLYTEEDPAVLASLEKIIRTCQRYRIAASICGEAPSNHPNLVKKLVEWGITSISVSPDAVLPTRRIVARMEHELVTARSL